jgi:hypothetical protein
MEKESRFFSSMYNQLLRVPTHHDKIVSLSQSWSDNEAHLMYRPITLEYRMVYQQTNHSPQIREEKTVKG